MLLASCFPVEGGRIVGLRLRRAQLFRHDATAEGGNAFAKASFLVDVTPFWNSAGSRTKKALPPFGARCLSTRARRAASPATSLSATATRRTRSTAGRLAPSTSA
jgi:hypothetical protein